MAWIVKNLWLIPALPILAAGLTALAPQRCRKFSASLAIGSMFLGFLLSLCAFAHTLHAGGHDAAKEVFNFEWLRFAAGDAGILKLGWMLDPLTAVMLVMVTFVGALIFIYSVGYMAHDENFTRFFTFLSLFAGAMLGVIISNSLLLLFMFRGNSSDSRLICSSASGITSPARLRRQKRRSSSAVPDLVAAARLIRTDPAWQKSPAVWSRWHTSGALERELGSWETLYRAATRDDSWRRIFSGKELFRAVRGETRFRLDVTPTRLKPSPAERDLDLARTVARTMVERNRVPKSVTDLRDAQVLTR